MIDTMRKVLANHYLANESRERYCNCGAPLGDWASPLAVINHQTEVMAEELKKAGYDSVWQARSDVLEETADEVQAAVLLSPNDAERWLRARAREELKKTWELQ